MIKHTILLSILLFVFLPLMAQPHVDVTPMGNVQIPYEWDYSVQRTNGDIWFYNVTYSDSTVQFTGFSFEATSSTLSQEVYIGSVTGLTGISSSSTNMDWICRYGKLYLMHKIDTGLVCFILNQNNITTHFLYDVVFTPFSQLGPRVEIVNENALVVAEEDALIYYNFQTSTEQVLLDGANYQCTLGQNPIVIYLPDEYFIYAKDNQLGGGDNPEIWHLFSSSGVPLSTMSSTSDILLGHVLYQLQGKDVPRIQGRWYLQNQSMVWMDSWLECSVVDGDLIQMYSFSMGDENTILSGLYPFGNDKIIRRYNNPHQVVMNYVPLEENLTPLAGFNPIDLPTAIAVISTDIDAMISFTDELVTLQIIWTGNDMEILPFSYPAAFSPDANPKTYVDNHILRIVMTDGIYSFRIEDSTPITDEEGIMVNTTLQIYPNPVYAAQSITIASSAKQNGTIEIYNLKGQKVKTMPAFAGKDTIWNLQDEQGKVISSGMYLCKLVTPGKVLTSKIVKLK